MQDVGARCVGSAMHHIIVLTLSSFPSHSLLDFTLPRPLCLMIVAHVTDISCFYFWITTRLQLLPDTIHSRYVTSSSPLSYLTNAHPPLSSSYSFSVSQVLVAGPHHVQSTPARLECELRLEVRLTSIFRFDVADNFLLHQGIGGCSRHIGTSWMAREWDLNNCLEPMMPASLGWVEVAGRSNFQLARLLSTYRVRAWRRRLSLLSLSRGYVKPGLSARISPPQFDKRGR